MAQRHVGAFLNLHEVVCGDGTRKHVGLALAVYGGGLGIVYRIYGICGTTLTSDLQGIVSDEEPVLQKR